MQFTIDRAIFASALEHVHGVIEQRHAQNLLSYIRIRTQDDGIELTGTDKEIFIQEIVGAEIATAGETIIPAKLAYEIVRKLPDGAVIDVSVANNHVRVESGKSRFSLNILDYAADSSYAEGREFPDPEEGPFDNNFTLPSQDFAGALKIVKLAISTDTMRHYLNGVYIHHQKDNLCFVATDGHRLAYFTYACPEGAQDMAGAIVPRKAVGELIKLCDHHQEELQISVSERLIRFQIANVKLTSKLIGGEFPDYERVIPQNNDKKMKIDAAKLRQSVERVNIFSDESSAVKLNVADNLLTLTTRSHEHGEATDELEVDYSDSALEIGYNARYLIDISDNISDEAEFSWLDSSGATIIRDLKNAQALYVLMPMRV